MTSTSSNAPESNKTGPGVLVVDDDEEALEECVGLLASFEAPILKARNAISALLSLTSKTNVGVVVTDIRMPGMDGISFLAEVQRLFQGQHCPKFVIITGHGTLDAAVAALRLDAIDFLQKPIDGSDLVCSVIRALSRYEAMISLGDRHSTNFGAKQALLSSAGKFDHADHSRVINVMRARRRRTDILGGDIFSEPAWTMLLELYLATLERRLLSVTGLTFASGAPNTTALRRIDDLVELQLIERAVDTYDRRRTHVFLSPSGLEKMSQLFRELKSFDGHI